jgi:hypothetical protein
MPDTAVSRKRKIKGYATRVTQSPAARSGAILRRDLAAPAGHRQFRDFSTAESI